MPEMLEDTPAGLVINVRVLPRAAKSAVSGTRAGALLVRLNAPPVDGAANAELIRLLAVALDVPKRAITIVAGARSPHKRVRVTGITRPIAEAKLCRVGS